MFGQHRKSAGEGGFTLVELLVVIAIISILATIVVPNVTRWIRKSRVTKALSEIKNADTMMRGMLTDARTTNFLDFFTPDARAAVEELLNLPAPYDVTGELTAHANAQRFYNEVFYELLRQGRDADECVARQILVEVVEDWLGLVPGDPGYIDPDITPGINCSGEGDPIFDLSITSRLGRQYMDITEDPWNSLYNFWLPPDRILPMRLRSYRSTDDGAVYTWDGPTRTALVEELPGQPQPDDLPGYPASRELPVYISSNGPNKVRDANLDLQILDYGGPAGGEADIDSDLRGGGDDINNWDNEAGWELAPQE